VTFIKFIFSFLGIFSAVFASVAFQLFRGELWGLPINGLYAVVFFLSSIAFVVAVVRDKKILYYFCAGLMFIVLGLLAYIPVAFSLSYHPNQNWFDLIIPLYGMILAFSVFIGVCIYLNYKKRVAP